MNTVIILVIPLFILAGDIMKNGKIAAPIVDQLRDGEEIERGFLGVSIQPVNDDLADALGLQRNRGDFVQSVQDGGAAEAAGIEAGDFITHVDGDSVLGLTLDEAVDMMRGPVGSEIIITVVREGEGEPFDVSIIRDTIKLTAVRSRTVGATVVLTVERGRRLLELEVELERGR